MAFDTDADAEAEQGDAILDAITLPSSIGDAVCKDIGAACNDTVHGTVPEFTCGAAATGHRDKWIPRTFQLLPHADQPHADHKSGNLELGITACLVEAAFAAFASQVTIMSRKFQIGWHPLKREPQIVGFGSETLYIEPTQAQLNSLVVQLTRRHQWKTQATLRGYGHYPRAVALLAYRLSTSMKSANKRFVYGQDLTTRLATLAASLRSDGPRLPPHSITRRMQKPSLQEVSPTMATYSSKVIPNQMVWLVWLAS